MVALQPAGERSLQVSAWMICLVTVAVVLRIIARLKTKAGLAIAEALIILAVCLFYTYQGLFLACTFSHGGINRRDIY